LTLLTAPSQFIVDLLGAFHKLDPNAGILPVQLPSKSEKNQSGNCDLLSSQDDFPEDRTTTRSITESFVQKYIGGLRIITTGGTSKKGTSMKGKIHIQTKCKLSTLKTNKAVQRWNGKNRVLLS
jgi:hypothetical protein